VHYQGVAGEMEDVTNTLPAADGRASSAASNRTRQNSKVAVPSAAKAPKVAHVCEGKAVEHFQCPRFETAEALAQAVKAVDSGTKATMCHMTEHTSWTSAMMKSWHSTQMRNCGLLALQQQAVTGKRLKHNLARLMAQGRPQAASGPVPEGQQVVMEPSELAGHDASLVEVAGDEQGDAPQRAGAAGGTEQPTADWCATPEDLEWAFQPQTAALFITATQNKVRITGTPHVLSSADGLKRIASIFVSSAQAYTQQQKQVYVTTGKLPAQVSDEGDAALPSLGSGVQYVSAIAVARHAVSEVLTNNILPWMRQRLKREKISLEGALQLVQDAGPQFPLLHMLACT
jgi:hypothetical protein